MKKLLEVKIDSLRVSLTNQQRIVVLKEVDHDRYLPVWIGPYEAESITIALQEIEVSRPQTHDLIKNILANLDINIKHVEISTLKDDIFYGTLVLIEQEKEIRVDCRPSDAIAIAVRAHVPILVAREVMEEASIIPEEITESQNEDMISESNDANAGEKQPINEDRLSIFEEYLKKKGIGSDQNDEEDEDDKTASPG